MQGGGHTYPGGGSHTYRGGVTHCHPIAGREAGLARAAARPPGSPKPYTQGSTGSMQVDDDGAWLLLLDWTHYSQWHPVALCAGMDR